ncbi:MAG: CsbD family protein [Candidatus Limnocylindrales bacterium]
MGNRIDEIQGQIKRSLGSLTGNEDMAREGEAQAEQARVERETEGAIDQGLGKAQETVGDVTGDTEMELKGKARQAEGEIKRTG